MRIADGRKGCAFMLALLTAACGAAPSENAFETSAQPSDQAAAAARPQEPRIDCAAPGDSELRPVCTLDRAETPNGAILTLRHPDGAFRRLQLTGDSRGVIAADGAEPAKVTPLGADRIVELGGARYRLPAIVRGQPR